MATPSFQSTTAMLLRECFEGKAPALTYTWFVEGKEGIFDAMDSVNAEQASYRNGPNSASIAAHTFHLLYALRGANTMQGGPEPEGNWEESWARQAVTAQEWRELNAAIHSEFASFMQWFQNQSDWSDESTLAGAIAVLPHMAFHLGAIRQLIRLNCE